MEETQIPITGLEELESHLKHIIDEPDTPLNADLFDEVELQLTDSNIPPLIPRLLPNVTQILLTYDKDPEILASLSIKLLRPVQFTQALTLASEDALIQALRSHAPSANILGITVLEKASRSPGDTAILSIMKGVVQSFVRIWLSTPHVEVGEKATKALGDLLEVDCDKRSSAGIDTRMSGIQLAGTPPGQGLLWRRIFRDRDIYGLIFSLCSFKTVGTEEGQLDERQKSLAQGRLLRILPRLAALDFHTVTHTQFRETEAQYGLQDGDHGLLFFAMVDMVDKQDILVHLNLIDIFIELLGNMSITEVTQTTLDYLATLTKKVAGSDGALYQSLEAISVSPDASPDLVELLVKLSRYQ